MKLEKDGTFRTIESNVIKIDNNQYKASDLATLMDVQYALKPK